ncbi:MAG: type I 3-dehydroquinate dehydratase [bacterium]|nr:type I 3-dehydroquinate dehydratase [bacterium]
MAIVVSHIANDFDTLARRALRQAELADLIELRLDRVGHPGEDVLREFIKSSPKPVVVTVHGPEAFGKYQGSVDERCELLLAASRAGAMFVDIDWTLSLELGEVEGKCHRIVSRHDTEETPDDLAAFDEEVRAVLYEGDAVKLVTHAHSTEDGLRVMRFLREAQGGLVAFCSGRAGSFTRVLAPIFGSPFTYAAPADLPGEPTPEPTAPGQWRVNDLLSAMPPGGLSPETAILGVVGNPIHLSLSPRVQGMALKNAHLDAVYVAFEPTDFDRFLDLADDENFRGLSVTAPFKAAAFGRASNADDASRRACATNTLVREGEGWRGYNTDVSAIREILETIFPVHAAEPGRPAVLAAAQVLVLGTGGAARAALGALRELDLTPTVAGRDHAAARALAADLGAQALAWDGIAEFAYDVLIHCTPVGSGDDGRSPIPPEWIRPQSLVLDAVYRPIKTPLLAAARERGCTAVPGAEWFIRQARGQFELFTRQPPDEPLMRAAFEHALGLGDASA